MAITFEEAAKRLGNAAVTVAGPGSERALVAAGVEAKNEMSRGGARDHLSGYGRGSRRGKVDAKARFDTQAGLRIVVEPTKPSRGLWALLERGSKDGTWKSPRRRGQRRARGSVGTYQREQVRARRTWSDAQPRATREAFQAYHRSITRQVFEDMRGR